MQKLYTIGHSNHSLDRFMGYLMEAGITHLIDVRSSPYSRYCPHFNQGSLQAECQADHINYIFKGAVLGGKVKDEEFDKLTAMATSLDNMVEWLKDRPNAKVAFMCAEANPKDCHRWELLANYLMHKYDAEFEHLHATKPSVTFNIEEMPELIEGLANNL